MKTYTISLLSGILAVLLIVAAFNWRVNPFDVFSTPAIAGFNLYKAEADRRGRLSKVYRVNRIKPDFVILGSSRALEIPVDDLTDEGLRGFNLSLASGSSYELLRMLQHAHAIQPVKRIIIGLDETLSLAVQPNFVEQRLAVDVDGSNNSMRWLAQWKDIFASLLSFDALRASIGTLRKQPDMSPESYKLKDKHGRVRDAGGHRQMFRRMESTVMAGYEGGVLTCDALSRPDVDHEKLATASFRKMLDMAYRENIDLHIFFSPVHARLYETRYMMGDWPEIENTKRAVVELVNQLANQYGLLPFPVWDFTGYNSITTEVLPESGDKDSLMQWYWEGSHYSEATAKLILDRMFSSGSVAADFGVQLNMGNIEQRLADIHLQRDNYLRRNPELIDELQSLLRQ